MFNPPGALASVYNFTLSVTSRQGCQKLFKPSSTLLSTRHRLFSHSPLFFVLVPAPHSTHSFLSLYSCLLHSTLFAMPISAMTQEAPVAAPVKTLVEAMTREETTTAVSHPTSVQEQELQQELETLEVVQDHLSKPELWRRRTAYSLVTDDYRIHHLTAGTLRGDNKLGIAPALFQSTDDSQVVSVLHVGKSLCGHPNIVHGGLLATILE